MKVKDLTKMALVASVYVVLSLVLGGFSFGPIQIRLGEMLTLLAIFDKRYIYALTLGCVIVNCFSPLGIIDVIVGSLSTFVSLSLVYYLAKKTKTLLTKLAIATAVITFFMWPIALELHVLSHVPFWLTFATTACGECLALLCGDIFILLLKQRYTLKER